MDVDQRLVLLREIEEEGDGALPVGPAGFQMRDAAHDVRAFGQRAVHQCVTAVERIDPVLRERDDLEAAPRGDLLLELPQRVEGSQIGIRHVDVRPDVTDAVGGGAQSRGPGVVVDPVVVLEPLRLAVAPDVDRLEEGAGRVAAWHARGLRVVEVDVVLDELRALPAGRQRRSPLRRWPGRTGPRRQVRPRLGGST